MPVQIMNEKTPILKLIKEMQASKRDEILNREKALRTDKHNNSKLVYRGVKIIVRLIRRVKKRQAV